MILAYANEVVSGYKKNESAYHSGEEEQVGMSVMVLVFALSSMMGLWGFSCIVSGLFHHGGLLQLGSSFVSAIFGM